MTIEEIKKYIKDKRERAVHSVRPTWNEWYDVWTMLDQFTPDPTADEMMEWVKRRSGFCEKEAETCILEVNQEYWKGARATAYNFLAHFREDEKPDPWQSYLRFAKEMQHG